MTQINFITSIGAAVAFLVATQTTSKADAQFGIGPSLYTNSEFGDEAGYGANVELGYLNSTSPINLFLGVRAGYLDGSDEGDTDVDVFDLSLMSLSPRQGGLPLSQVERVFCASSRCPSGGRVIGEYYLGVAD